MKFKFIILFATAFLISSSICYAISNKIPVKIKEYDKLNWKITLDDTKLFYQNLKCSNQDLLGFKTCIINDIELSEIEANNKMERNYTSTASLLYFNNELNSIDIKYKYQNKDLALKAVNGLSSKLNSLMEKSQLKTVLPDGSETIEYDTLNTKVSIERRCNNVNIYINNVYNSLLRHDPKYREHTTDALKGLDEQVKELNRLKNIPKLPKISCSRPSKFDKDKKLRCGMSLNALTEYKDKEAFNLISENNKYFLSAHIYTFNSSVISLDLIIDDGDVVTLKPENYDKLNEFRIPNDLLEKMLKSKSIDYKVGYRTFVSEKFKESWFTSPEYREGKFNEMQINWMKQFYDDTRVSACD
ncbi:MAG: hypothetical protein GJT30_07815 [Geobacter sp.]|nr:hypothetical protein [Geobacter sp.]